MRSQTEQLHRTIAEQAAFWLVAQSEAPLDAVRTREFMQWLRTSPMHVEEYLMVSRVSGRLAEAARREPAPWQLLVAKESRVVPFPSSWRGTDRGAEAWRPVRDTLAGRIGETVAVARARWAVGWSAAVAGLAVAALVVLSTPWPLAGETIVTRHGEIRTVALPDKSLVTLDSNSAVRVQFDRHARHVNVERGQAYFDIRDHDGPAFIVAAGAASIRDIGTQFNVRRGDRDTVVTVSTGLVEVSKIESGPQARQPSAGVAAVDSVANVQVAMVGSGEQATMTDAGDVTRPRAIDVAQAIAWTKSRIDFKNSPVESVANELNRYNVTQITIASGPIRHMAVTGVIGVKDSDAFVAFLGGLPGVHVVRRGSVVVITRGQDAVRDKGLGFQ